MLIGVVEEPGSNEKKAFQNVYELWEILNPVKKLLVMPKRGKSSRRRSNDTGSTST